MSVPDLLVAVVWSDGLRAAVERGEPNWTAITVQQSFEYVAEDVWKRKADGVLGTLRQTVTGPRFYFGFEPLP